MTGPGGSVAVVTGGGSGIGAALVAILSRRPIKIAVFSDKAVDETRAALDAVGLDPGCTFVSYQVDVADRAAVFDAFAQVESELGTVDLLANNAGIFTYAPIEDTTLAQAQRLLDVNYLGCLNCIQAVLPGMRRLGRGAIVNVASLAAEFPAGRTAAYAASKGAIVALTRALVPELAKSGVRINAVMPGGVRTPMSAAFHRPSTPEGDAILARRMDRSLSPFGKSHLEAVDVAEVVAFLLSDASRGIQGVALPVSDGLGSAMEPYL